jgi:hypothetical protein
MLIDMAVSSRVKESSTPCTLIVRQKDLLPCPDIAKSPLARLEVFVARLE